MSEPNAAGSDSEPVLEVANEFAAVLVRLVTLRNGVRLELTTPRFGHTVRLDALALESLTWQPPETFSRLLEDPFGSESHPDGAP